MSRLALGTMSFGDTADEKSAAAMVETALAAGINGIDTANGYAGGTTEGMIAPLVRRHRDQVVLATKAGMPHPDAEDHAPLSARGLRASVEGSLRRLGVEHIDLFYLHQPDRATPVVETLDTVATLHEEGKIGALGVSNHSAWQVLEILREAERRGLAAPVVGQNVYNLVARRMEDEWFEFAARYEVLTMCYNPLAGGLLVRRPANEALTRFSGSVLAEMYRRRYWGPEVLATITRLADLADEAGIPLVELALRWMISVPGPGALLLGATGWSSFRTTSPPWPRGPSAVISPPPAPL
ncbi:MAG: aldo/keto reductase [Arachnia propionica]|uniref:aldo/keto reductase n=1 Tax=Arachnia propionica TaxID=1750 RepID=UPI0026F94BAB|nr:aldo/keto reductase [Arachnia propionica]